jgi:hypothetical protein
MIKHPSAERCWRHNAAEYHSQSSALSFTSERCDSTHADVDLTAIIFNYSCESNCENISEMVKLKSSESMPLADVASKSSLHRIEATSGWRLIDFGEIWEYRDLFYFLIRRDIKTRYA